MARKWPTSTQLNMGRKRLKGCLTNPKIVSHEYDTFSSAGLEIEKVGFNVAVGEIFVWVEGTKDQIGAVEFTAMAAGAFAAISITKSISSNEMLQLMKAAASLKDTYQPPNQDEIGRMFLA